MKRDRDIERELRKKERENEGRVYIERGVNLRRGNIRAGQELLQAIACPGSNRLAGGGPQAIAWLRSKRLVTKIPKRSTMLNTSITHID